MSDSKPDASRIKFFDPEKFNKSLSFRPQLRDMKVGQGGFLSPGTLLFLRGGDVYLNVSIDLIPPSESKGILDVAVIAIRRTSNEKHGYEISCKKMEVIDYSRMNYFKTLDDYLDYAHWVRKEDIVLIGNVKSIFAQVNGLMRFDEGRENSKTSK